MEDFFAVWEASKDVYDLERKVHIDLDGAEIRIYAAQALIIKVEGEYQETEELYQIAALRLLEWIRKRRQ